jgi:inorganic pyrophosphatase
MTDLLKLPAFAADGTVHAVVETPRHACTKYKYEPVLGCFVLSRTLMTGLSYPYNWGFIPSTVAADGDPLDTLIICDATTFPGLVLNCQAIGVLEVAQTEKGKTVRNDRVFLVPVKARDQRQYDSVFDMSALLRNELEEFFIASVAGTNKKLRMLGWRGPVRGAQAIRKAARAYQAHAGKGGQS